MLEDRDRIARDLHDQVIQRLYASGMKLQGTLPLIDRPEAAERAGSVVDEMDMTIKDIRTVIFRLQAGGGKDRPGLGAQITQIVQKMTGALGMSSSLQLDGRLNSQIPPTSARICCALCARPCRTQPGTARRPRSM